MRILTVASALTLLVACGGGGGGGSSTDLIYTGPTAQAVIGNVSDGQTLSVAILASSATGMIDDVAEHQNLSRATPFLPGLLKALSSNPITPAVVNVYQGACGGTLTATLDGTASAITGTMVYANYCINPEGFAILINGTCGLTGQDFGGTGNYSEQLSVKDLRVAVAGETYTCNLTFAATYTNNVIGPISFTCTYKAPDSKVYLASNYQVVMGEGNSSLTISGKFYHPNYGCVTVTTPTPLVYSDCSGTWLPTGGSLQITGANCVTATFTPQSCSTYQICIDNGTQTCQTFNWPS